MCACGFVSIQAGITDGAIEAVAAQDKPSTPMNPLLQKGCSLRPWFFFQFLTCLSVVVAKLEGKMQWLMTLATERRLQVKKK